MHDEETIMFGATCPDDFRLPALDLDLLTGCRYDSLWRAALSVLGPGHPATVALAPFEESASACHRAAALCGIDDVRRTLPQWLSDGLWSRRKAAGIALRDEVARVDPGARERHDRLRPVHLALVRMERNGVPLDGRVDTTTRYDPVGGRTERIAIRRGLNTMSIPKGESRRKIRSRLGDAGRIVSLDFNAIDLRCIVSRVPEMVPLYAGCDDFHARTHELVSGRPPTDDERRMMKSLTYPMLYGGPFGADSYSEKLRYLFTPIVEFRRRLHAEKPEEHAGATLAIFAQTLSSRAFKAALVAADIEMLGLDGQVLPIFPVHDELVLDVSVAGCRGSALGRVNALKMIVKEMESAAAAAAGIECKVVVASGPSYGELESWR